MKYPLHTFDFQRGGLKYSAHPYLLETAKIYYSDATKVIGLENAVRTDGEKPTFTILIHRYFNEMVILKHYEGEISCDDFARLIEMNKL